MEQQTMIALVGNILYVIGTILVAASLRVRGDLLAGNLLAMMVTIPIALYALNCAVIGNCITYAWIYAYISVAVGILIIILGVYFMILGPPVYPREEERFGAGYHGMQHGKEHFGAGYHGMQHGKERFGADYHGMQHGKEHFGAGYHGMQHGMLKKHHYM